MKKIPTIFIRNPDDMSRLLNKPHPDCDWVFAGEGIATRKYDGTCCMVRNGVLYKRREVKKGKPDPVGFILEQEDENTGKRVGWLVVDHGSQEDKYHTQAWNADDSFADGTYELLGPKIQGNPEKMDSFRLLPHADATKLDDAPTNYAELESWLAKHDIEGLVWHNPDGRMAKIKLKDFGIKRPTPETST